MIQLIDGKQPESTKMIEGILSRSQLEFGEINDSVRDIVQCVKKLGDKAIIEYTKKFDGVNLESFIVTEDEIEEGYNQFDKALIEALLEAKDNIWSYHS